MQIYGRRRRRLWWLCFCCWNSIILRGFTASQINCHYKKRVHSLNSVSVRAYNVQNRSNIGDNCVCDKWSSVQQPCPPQDTRPAAGEYTPPIFCCCFWSQNVYHPCFISRFPFSQLLRPLSNSHPAEVGSDGRTERQNGTQPQAGASRRRVAETEGASVAVAVS